MHAYPDANVPMHLNADVLGTHAHTLTRTQYTHLQTERSVICEPADNTLLFIDSNTPQRALAGCCNAGHGATTSRYITQPSKLRHRATTLRLDLAP